MYKTCDASCFFQARHFVSAAKAFRESCSPHPARGANVNKTDLIDRVSVSTELNKTSAARAVEAVLDIIAGTLRDGDSVTLSGFGTFSVSNRSQRTGRNPRTGEMITIPASKAPKFKSGKGLKDALN
ncbi:MAG: HU family DNA-binding protein [Sulfuricaulis sp.]|uniref:HU family DNA-binding protein n=1 Tax=Sulfuricaulis sp. TaxID=2003553 RepID=UPI0025F9F4F6|nr:HU family DNA-binding protein [Sulfuricaulis sp.]MCR4346489.1 HU family DNA-binding protein [Sulfuricaulis sp.]